MRNNWLYAALIVSSIVPLLSHASDIIMGAIQFPAHLSNVPMIRVYCGGRKIKSEVDNSNKKITFTLPKGHNQRRFLLLITEDLDFKRLDTMVWGSTQNTLDYLKIEPNQTYKLYIMTLMTDTSNIKTGRSSKPSLKWIIEEGELRDEDCRIPDETIIIRYNPDMVETVSSTSVYELPTIVMKNQLLKLVGSELELQKISNEQLMASIDSDTFHAAVQEHIKFDGTRVLIAPTA